MLLKRHHLYLPRPARKTKLYTASIFSGGIRPRARRVVAIRPFAHWSTIYVSHSSQTPPAQTDSLSTVLYFSPTVTSWSVARLPIQSLLIKQ